MNELESARERKRVAELSLAVEGWTLSCEEFKFSFKIEARSVLYC